MAVLVGAGLALVNVLAGLRDETTFAPEDLTLQDLEPALLTADDVGGGYAPTSDFTQPIDLAHTVPYSGPDVCLELAERLPGAHADVASAGFQNPSDGTIVYHTLDPIEEEGESLAAIDEEVDQCGPVFGLIEQGDDTIEVDWLGSGTVGVSETADTYTFGLTIQIVRRDPIVVGNGYVVVYMWARDGVMTSVVVTGGALDPATGHFPPADPLLASQLRRTADAKLRQALESNAPS